MLCPATEKSNGTNASTDNPYGEASLEELKDKLDLTVRAEEYKAAAAIRDEIRYSPVQLTDNSDCMNWSVWANIHQQEQQANSSLTNSIFSDIIAALHGCLIDDYFSTHTGFHCHMIKLHLPAGEE